jgi:integrase
MTELIRRAELVKANVITAAENNAADHADRPLAEHFDAYVAHLRAKGNDPHRITQVRARLGRVTTDCGFGRLSQLGAAALERWLVARQDERMSAATRNGYREALVGFGNWCRRTHRLIANPFIDVPIADVNSDRRRVRRALTEDELVKLLGVARRRPLCDALLVRRGARKGQAAANVRPDVKRRLEQVGRERALIYKTLVLTGLRKGELASITVGNVDLDSLNPYIVLNAADEKNRQGAEVPLRADLAGDIQSWLADKLKVVQDSARLKIGEPIPMRLPANTRLFNVPSGLIRILDRDLVAAGIARLVKDPKTGKTTLHKCDDRGRTIDVHALRTTFGTHLSKGGVPLRTAQAAMRHSKPDLTANVYTDPKLLDVAGALDALPALPLDREPAREHAKATGTDGAHIEASRAIALLIALNSGQTGTRRGAGDHGEGSSMKIAAGAPVNVSDVSVNTNGSQSTSDHEPSSKRAKGVEPSTFTLAIGS